MAARLVLITGANSGVGFATAKVIASAPEGFHVIMTGRSLESVNKAMAEIKEAGGVKGQLSSMQLDVKDEKSIDQAVAAVSQNHGRLDVLINNAAVGSLDPDTRTRFQATMETNVLGPMLVSEGFRPLLLKSEHPYSIYVSSGGGSLAMAAGTSDKASTLPRGEMYRASKAALHMIMLEEVLYFKSEGLKSFSVCPGFVVSNLRGKDEEARTGWGKAGDPMVSGQTILSIVRGERDADAGKLIHKDGIYPW